MIDFRVSNCHDWIKTSYDSLPESSRLVLGGWHKPQSDEVALVRYIAKNCEYNHGWVYIDNSVCFSAPDYWKEIHSLPTIDPNTKICDTIGCNNYAKGLFGYAPASNSSLCNVCIEEQIKLTDRIKG